MPSKSVYTKSKQEEIARPTCPTCGTILLKSGYCPKCHRKKDGTKGKGPGRPKIEPEEQIGANVADFSQPPSEEPEHYLCEGCSAKVHYLQRKCRNCGIYLDWRGSEAESDETAIICPMCGAFCGYEEDDPVKCPHCGYGG